MYTETEGIILKQTKTINGKRMILLFTKKYGKISAGTIINEKGKGKSALAMRPFTHGKYELFKKGDYFSVNGAEVIKSFYPIGENVEKYMNASYGLEFTEKILIEGESVPGLFNLCIDFLNLMEIREKKYETVVLGYEIKALKEIGYWPEINKCVACGRKDGLKGFSVRDGGILCENCFNKMKGDRLIFAVDFDIVNVLKFFINNPLESLEKLALEEGTLKQVKYIIKQYEIYHLDLGELKSEMCLKI